MRFRLLGLLLLVFAAALAAREGPAQELPYGQGLLWRVERDGAAPSHLFGTIHTTDERVLDLPPPVRRAFDAAGSLTIELRQGESKLMVKVQKRMLIGDSRLLDEILGPDLFARMTATAACYGIPARALKLLQPWALWTIFSFSPAEAARAGAGELALDRYLEAEAAARGKPVHALETVAEQLDAISGFPVEVDIAILRTVEADCEALADEFEQVTKFYLARDLAAIHDWVTAELEAIDPAYAALLEARLIDNRNALMVERMAGRLIEGNAFVAVGAMHLPGDGGILDRLDQAGYAITRMY